MPLPFVFFRKFVGGVGLFVVFSLWLMCTVSCCNYMLLKFSLVYMTVLILVCVVDFDFLSFLSGGFFCV